MADCSKIAAGLAATACNTVAVPGTAARVILMNYSGVNRSNSIVTNNVVELIGYSEEGYAFYSLPDATIGSVALAKGTYINQFDHTVEGRVFVKSEAAKAFLNGLKNALLIAVVENIYFNAADATPVKYEVYGWDAGLKVSELTANTSNPDQTVYTFKLASRDNAKEGSLPKTCYSHLYGLLLTDSMLDTICGESLQ